MLASFLLESNVSKYKQRWFAFVKESKQYQGFEFPLLCKWKNFEKDLVFFTDDGFLSGKLQYHTPFEIFIVPEDEEERIKLLKNQVAALLTSHHFELISDQIKIDKALWKEARIAPKGAWKNPVISEEEVQRCIDGEHSLKLLLQNGVTLEGVPSEQSQTAILLCVPARIKTRVVIYKHAVLKSLESEGANSPIG